MSTVYGIVKQHQGWAKVSSALTHGTSFRFAGRPTRWRQRRGTRAKQPGVGQDETILVVEDEPALLDLVGS
ncbi:MAG: hypothetical protein U1G07_21935 [Verrucomicrobiota bacterium]